MATTTITLRITDGTTTADFSTTSTTFALRDPGWAPGVSVLRDTKLGGATEYADVDEFIPLDVLGSTAAIAQANLRTLEGLLTQAKRFEKGENVTAVRIEVQVQGSDLATPLQARVRAGRVERIGPEYASGTLYAPAGIPVDIALTRTGVWLSDSEEASTTGTSMPSYSFRELTFATALSQSIHPTRVQITGLTITNGSWQPGYLALALADEYFLFKEAESQFSGGTTVGITGASNGNIKRFTTTTGNSSFAIGAPLATASTIQYLANINVVSGTWYGFARLYYSGGSVIDTPYILLTGSYPHLVAFPPLPNGSTATDGELFFVGSGYIHCDYFVLVGNAQLVQIGDPGGYPTSTPSLILDPAPLTQRRPNVSIYNGATKIKSIPSEGDAFWATGSTTIAVGWFQNETDLVGQYQWSITASGPGSAAKTHSIQAFRRRAYIIPE